MVLGGYQLHEGDDSVISVVPQEQVADVAAALQDITFEEFKSRYYQIDHSDSST